MQETPEVFMALIALLQHAETLRHKGVRRIAGGHGPAATNDRIVGHIDGGRVQRGRGGRQCGTDHRCLTELLDASQDGLLVEVILDAHILRTRKPRHFSAESKRLNLKSSSTNVASLKSTPRKIVYAVPRHLFVISMARDLKRRDDLI